MWPILITGLTLGFVSSFHCVGMCGPIALALPVQQLTAIKKFYSILSYNLGRVSTYSLLGLIFGFFGRQIYVAGLQSWFSVLLGILVLLTGFFYFVRKKALEPAFAQKLHLAIQVFMSRFLHSKHIPGFFMLGALNGLLPCGMVYLAIAGALNTNQVWDGTLFMAMYGLGTLPAMIAITSFGYFIDLRLRNRIKRAMPLMMGIMGVMLIIRGMNLGIPYISPIINFIFPEAVSCH